MVAHRRHNCSSVLVLQVDIIYEERASLTTSIQPAMAHDHEDKSVIMYEPVCSFKVQISI